MLENPQLLEEMVKASGAKSTDLQSPESVEHLCAKCHEYAANWKTPAEQIWSCQKHFTPHYENYKK